MGPPRFILPGKHVYISQRVLPVELHDLLWLLGNFRSGYQAKGGSTHSYCSPFFRLDLSSLLDFGLFDNSLDIPEYEREIIHVNVFCAKKCLAN